MSLSRKKLVPKERLLFKIVILKSAQVRCTTCPFTTMVFTLILSTLLYKGQANFCTGAECWHWTQIVQYEYNISNSGLRLFHMER